MNRKTRFSIGIMAGCMLLAACAAEPITSPDANQAVESPGTAPDAGSWKLVAPKGAGPVDVNASTLAPGLQAVFAAKMFDYQAGTLWRFDLRTDSWTQLPATNWPIGKYRKLIYDAPNHRLLTYWDGLGQVYSIPETGGAWVPEGTAPNLEEYYEAYGFFNPASRRLAVFAGYGFGNWKDTFWEWDGAGNQWLGMTQGTPRPEPRFGHGPSTVAVDVAGKRAFLGQRSLGTAPGNYDDLWVVDLRTYTWTNLIGPSTGASARLGSALAYAARTSTLYRFGGCGPIIGSGICTRFGNELLSANPNRAPVAWTRIRTAGAAPTPRMLSGLYYDPPRNRLILVSGLDGMSWQDDVWSYKLP